MIQRKGRFGDQRRKLRAHQSYQTRDNSFDDMENVEDDIFGEGVVQKTPYSGDNGVSESENLKSECESDEDFV